MGAPTPPPNPCTTATPAAKLYSVKEQGAAQDSVVPKKASNTVPAWAFALFGVLGMLSCFSLAAGLRIRNKRSTRQIQVVQPVPQSADAEALLRDLDEPIE